VSLKKQREKPDEFMRLWRLKKSYRRWGIEPRELLGLNKGISACFVPIK